MWYVEQHQQQLFVMVFLFFSNSPLTVVLYCRSLFFHRLDNSLFSLLLQLICWIVGDCDLISMMLMEERRRITTKIFCFSLVDPLSLLRTIQSHPSYHTQCRIINFQKAEQEDNCRLIFHYIVRVGPLSLHTLDEKIVSVVDALLYSHENWIDSTKTTKKSEGMRNHKDRHIQRITVIASINSASQYFFDAIISVMSNERS